MLQFITTRVLYCSACSWYPLRSVSILECGNDDVELGVQILDALGDHVWVGRQEADAPPRKGTVHYGELVELCMRVDDSASQPSEELGILVVRRGGDAATIFKHHKSRFDAHPVHIIVREERPDEWFDENFLPPRGNKDANVPGLVRAVEDRF